MSDSIARRLFLKFLGIGTAAAAAGCTGPQNGRSASDETEDGFEYIVVGSGAGGGPLAANLARNGHRVLLLEAGEDKGDLLTYQVPAFHPQSSEDPQMRWDYFVKHYSDADRQAQDSKATPEGVLYPRAGTLGGCTAHNAMITVYPHESDWDSIASLTGDDTWSSQAMRRYFQILENCQYLGKLDSRDGHGFSGWLTTNLPDVGLALTDKKLLKIVLAAVSVFNIDSIFGKSLSQLSDAFLNNKLVSLLHRDLNVWSADRDQTEGPFAIPLATTGGKRNGPREFILRTVAEGYPLTVRTRALVTRLLFDDAPDDSGNLRVTGVEYMSGAHMYRADPNASGVDTPSDRTQVKASREVILSAGAFNTPQLLKLSGIGPRDELEALGIDVKLELPGVGQNLQDRYEVGVVSEVSSDFTSIEACTFDTTGQADDPCRVTWQSGKGVYTSNGGVVGIVKRSSDDKPDPDLFVFGLAGNFKGYYPGYSANVSTKHHFTWAILKAHTNNTAGSVTLRTTDPRDVPEINFRYFDEGSTDQGQDAADLNSVIAGVTLARQIGDATRSLFLFDKYTEIVPGPSVQTQDDIAAFVKREAWGHHASCTCKIGADDDPMAVLDSRFRVRGTVGLRVVDASVFPRIPGFFIVVPIYMISEKATDVLLEDIGEVRA